MKTATNNKKAIAVNIIAQCVLYISVTVFAAADTTGKELPDAMIIIFMILDLLTITASMYFYLKSITKDSNTIVYVCFAEGIDSKLPKSKYLRIDTADESEWFSIYDFSDYDDYKYWPETWKQRRDQK